MDFNEDLHNLSNRIPKMMSNIKTEEATKTGLIMPFLQILGYNVFDPMEVCPECVADVGTKKGEKVDYAIMKDGQPIILIECKSVDVDLATVHKSQLYRYFTVLPVKIGILTNGKNYLFYSDFENTNKMDSKPFLEIDMLNLTDQQIEALKQFRKETFNVDKILPSAMDMKYIKSIKQIFSKELESPSNEFVKHFTNQVYDGRITKNVLDDFTDITKRAFTQFINDIINDRLKSAMTTEEAVNTVEKVDEDDSEIVTTEIEIEGFNIVRAILSEIVEPERVFIRDVKSYCGVLLDDTNRKQICRMYFNSPTKKYYLGLFINGNEEKFPITKPSDIFKYSNQLRDYVKQFEK